MKTYTIVQTSDSITVTHCFYGCPYFGTSMDGMECFHPVFEGGDTYKRMIISWDEDIKNDVPLKCPLRIA